MKAYIKKQVENTVLQFLFQKTILPTVIKGTLFCIAVQWKSQVTKIATKNPAS